MKIGVKTWKIVTEKGEKKLAGTYNVVSGATEIATQTFNDGYGSVDVPISATLMAKIEELDDEIREAISNHYGIGD